MRLFYLSLLVAFSLKAQDTPEFPEHYDNHLFGVPIVILGNYYTKFEAFEVVYTISSDWEYDPLRPIRVERLGDHREYPYTVQNQDTGTWAWLERSDENVKWRFYLVDESQPEQVSVIWNPIVVEKYVEEMENQFIIGFPEMFPDTFDRALRYDGRTMFVPSFQEQDYPKFIYNERFTSSGLQPDTFYCDFSRQGRQLELGDVPQDFNADIRAVNPKTTDDPAYNPSILGYYYWTNWRNQDRIDVSPNYVTIIDPNNFTENLDIVACLVVPKGEEPNEIYETFTWQKKYKSSGEIHDVKSIGFPLERFYRVEGKDKFGGDAIFAIKILYNLFPPEYNAEDITANTYNTKIGQRTGRFKGYSAIKPIPRWSAHVLDLTLEQIIIQEGSIVQDDLVYSMEDYQLFSGGHNNTNLEPMLYSQGHYHYTQPPIPFDRLLLPSSYWRLHQPYTIGGYFVGTESRQILSSQEPNQSVSNSWQLFDFRPTDEGRFQMTFNVTLRIDYDCMHVATRQDVPTESHFIHGIINEDFTIHN